MVHNAIEYFNMQLIAEKCNIPSNVFRLTPADLVTVFGHWKRGCFARS
jgi:6-phosphogluconate dehydrogenase